MARPVAVQPDEPKVALGSLTLDLIPCDLRDVAHASAEVARPAMEVREQRFEEGVPDALVIGVVDSRRLPLAARQLLMAGAHAGISTCNRRSARRWPTA